MQNDTISKLKDQRYGATGKLQWVIKELAHINAVIYTSDAEAYYTATAYVRKALKPRFQYYFKTREARDEYAQKWIKNTVEREASKKADRAKQNAPHTLVVGDVLNTSWGYDQTNVDYFQVVELKGKATVKLREISAVSVDDSHVRPYVNEFVGKVFEKRVNSRYNSVKISSCQTATPVRKDDDGKYKPNYRTPWGMGH